MRLLILAGCVAVAALVNYLVGGWIGPGLAGGLVVFLGMEFAMRWRRQDTQREPNEHQNT
ncbi:hypothetical protein [Kibdelosporangium aridum]|uniref:hypothetical protein n=1 Tax=Kibdelosporangium aridum TaxID=2030 RepID=UPI00052424D2